ncbi:MAG: DUF924 family protein [Pseudomonadota bacterium]
MTVVSPDDILDDWIGPAAHDAVLAEARKRVWFGKSDAVDRDLEARYLPTIEALAAGLAETWAERGPRPRLAAIIAMDQFTRNIFRDTPNAFSLDSRALGLAKEGLVLGQDRELTEVEQMFFYLPLEHSERAADQQLSVDLFTRLAESARPPFKALVDDTLDYAHKHKAVIDQFGRFPHRNVILGRESTPEETAYLSQPGAGF